MVIMGYLVYLHYAPVQGSFCNLGENFSCEIVNKSVYSAIWGIPMAGLGFAYFLGVFLLSAFWYNARMLRLVGLGTLVLLGPSFYLTVTSIVVLKTSCILCEAAKALMIAVAGLSVWALWPERPRARYVAGAVLVAVLLAGITYSIHARLVPPGTYTEFAQCLAGKGYIMYGSLGCSFCAKQRAMFGDAFRYVTEIECDPRYPNDEAERCIAKQIEGTPTWIQEDASGATLFRFPTGVQSLENLSSVSSCPLPAAK